MELKGWANRLSLSADKVIVFTPDPAAHAPTLTRRLPDLDRSCEADGSKNKFSSSGFDPVRMSFDVPEAID